MSKVQFDENNPNVMSSQKIEALENTIDRYGFAVEPWLNDLGNGKYMVIDGEHRVRLLQKNKVKKFSAKIFKIKYTEVRMLRQIANKLRGEHDKQKDAAEFKAIFDDGYKDDFALLSGKSLIELEKIINLEFNFKQEEAETIDLLNTDNTCPKCGYEW